MSDDDIGGPTLATDRRVWDHQHFDGRDPHGIGVSKVASFKQPNRSPRGARGMIAAMRDLDTTRDDASAVYRAARAARLIQKPTHCAKCGAQPIPAALHGHHEDYGQPLMVEWLCARCHRVVHALKRIEVHG